MRKFQTLNALINTVFARVPDHQLLLEMDSSVTLIEDKLLSELRTSGDEQNHTLEI